MPTTYSPDGWADDSVYTGMPSISVFCTFRPNVRYQGGVSLASSDPMPAGLSWIPKTPNTDVMTRAAEMTSPSTSPGAPLNLALYSASVSGGMSTDAVAVGATAALGAAAAAFVLTVRPVVTGGADSTDGFGGVKIVSNSRRAKASSVQV